MAIELELKPGQTPLDPDEVAGLKPRHIATQGELDEWEAQNILKASRWIARQKKLDVLNDHFCRELHTKMFDDTWKWAGTFRKSDKILAVTGRRLPSTCVSYSTTWLIGWSTTSSRQKRLRCAFIIDLFGYTPSQMATADMLAS